ncbi:LacI family DNA-binding transcriptional regulator [Aggregatilinea lenta]|uniref:LacI family DNA-binding transcriptional regulator n=1 Tax=Aggregatilinea lenta TaxID=913108 RepID=UPI000E5AD987|nr:LacI family DNA-binding transcriptional regulator [Aggregatilinea lenta]
MSKSKATMRDIALAADVSVTTVWMVIHNKSGISPQTAEKVWSAISNLNYKPRKSDGSSKLETVGLLIEQSSIPAISDVFYGDVIRGVQSEAERLGMRVVLSVFDRNKRGFDLNGLIHDVSGVVVANDGDLPAQAVLQLKALDMPVVLIESYIADQSLPCVLGDNFMAGYQITRHILNLGHRDIAILRGPSKYSSLVDRLHGCMAAMAEEHLLFPPEWMPEPLSGHPIKGYVQMQEILALDHRPTAVIAISDKTAIGAMEAIREAGLHIPDDIAIGSIDNTRESQFARPPLTTVHIPKYEIGMLAMQKLNRIIMGENTAAFKSVVYSELIVRDSCGSKEKGSLKP